jgi:hypothetical protein
MRYHSLLYFARPSTTASEHSEEVFLVTHLPPNPSRLSSDRPTETDTQRQRRIENMTKGV